MHQMRKITPNAGMHQNTDTKCVNRGQPPIKGGPYFSPRIKNSKLTKAQSYQQLEGLRLFGRDLQTKQKANMNTFRLVIQIALSEISDDTRKGVTENRMKAKRIDRVPCDNANTHICHKTKEKK